MRFVHGDVTLEIEDSWQDQSQIAFAEAPDESLAREFARRAVQSGAPVHLEAPALNKPRDNFVLSSRIFDLELGDMTPREFCEREVRALAAGLTNCKVGEFFWAKLGGVDAAMIDIELALEDSPLKQLHGMAVYSGRFFHFVGTSTPGGFEKVKPRFLAVMGSIQASST